MPDSLWIRHFLCRACETARHRGAYATGIAPKVGRICRRQKGRPTNLKRFKARFADGLFTVVDGLFWTVMEASEAEHACFELPDRFGVAHLDGFFRAVFGAESAAGAVV